MKTTPALLLMLYIGGALIVCDGIPVEPPSTTRASVLGRSLVSTTGAPDKKVIPGQSEYSVRKCSIRPNALDSLATVPETMGVDQEVLSCVTCMASEGQEVHALLVDEPVVVGSLHSPQNNRHDDIDVYLTAMNQPSPITLILASRRSVSWHIIADIKETPLKEVILISPKGIERNLDVRWPHRTSPLALTSGQLSIKELDADIGHLQSKDELKQFFKVLGPGSFVTSLTSIHRTHVWRLDVGIKSRCSGYEKPYWGGPVCSGKTGAVIAVVTCGVVGIALIIIACVVHRCRRGRRNVEDGVKEKNKPETTPDSEYHDLKFTDNTEKEEALQGSEALPSTPDNFYFTPGVTGHSERLAQQEEMLKY